MCLRHPVAACPIRRMTWPNMSPPPSPFDRSSPLPRIALLRRPLSVFLLTLADFPRLKLGPRDVGQLGSDGAGTKCQKSLGYSLSAFSKNSIFSSLLTVIYNKLNIELILERFRRYFTS